MEKLAIRPQVDIGQLTLDDGIRTLEGLVSSLREVPQRGDLTKEEKRNAEALFTGMSARLERARGLRRTMEQLAENCEELALDMDFTFLYNRQRKLLSIGYTKNANRLESACYDLLGLRSTHRHVRSHRQGRYPARKLVLSRPRPNSMRQGSRADLLGGEPF